MIFKNIDTTDVGGLPQSLENFIHPTFQGSNLQKPFGSISHRLKYAVATVKLAFGLFAILDFETQFFVEPEQLGGAFLDPLFQMLLGLAQGNLRGFPIGDIPKILHHPNDFARWIENRESMQFHPPNGFPSPKDGNRIGFSAPMIYGIQRWAFRAGSLPILKHDMAFFAGQRR